MQRRNFLTLAGAAGLGLLLPPVRKARADGASATYGGPFWITVQADGGWDPTYVCDPKGGKAGDKTTINQRYTPDQIGHTGDFSWAPVSINVADGNGGMAEVYSARKFFEQHGSEVVVFNGIDTQTNNHDTGRRLMWSGFTVDGYPNIGALAAAQAFGSVPVPMAFLSYGGYDSTGNLVPLTRASNVDNLWKIAYPNRISANNAMSSAFYTQATADRITAAQAARTQRLQQAALPLGRRTLGSLLTVRQNDSALQALTQDLPAHPVKVTDLPDLQGIPSGSLGGLGQLQNLMQQAQLALAAFQAGVGVSASLVIGGFDTHSDHDNQHVPRLVQLLRGVDYILQTAKTLGLGDKVYVLLTSDFGRTPWYNAGNGKDHWAATSMIVSGPGIVGGRVIGSTDASFKPVAIDPMSLRPSSTGMPLHPLDIHHALRKLGGFDTGALAAQYPLPGTGLPLFG